MFARLAVIIASSIIGHLLNDYCLITFNLFVVVVIGKSAIAHILNVRIYYIYIFHCRNSHFDIISTCLIA